MQVVTLIKYVQSRQGARMWEHEAMTLSSTELPSAILLGSLVQSVVDAIFFQVIPAAPPQLQHAATYLRRPQSCFAAWPADKDCASKGDAAENPICCCMFVRVADFVVTVSSTVISI